MNDGKDIKRIDTNNDDETQNRQEAVLNDLFNVKNFIQEDKHDTIEKFSKFLNHILMKGWDNFMKHKYKLWKDAQGKEDSQ